MGDLPHANPARFPGVRAPVQSLWRPGPGRCRPSWTGACRLVQGQLAVRSKGRSRSGPGALAVRSRAAVTW